MFVHIFKVLQNAILAFYKKSVSLQSLLWWFLHRRFISETFSLLGCLKGLTGSVKECGHEQQVTRLLLNSCFIRTIQCFQSILTCPSQLSTTKFFPVCPSKPATSAPCSYLHDKEEVYFVKLTFRGTFWVFMCFKCIQRQIHINSVTLFIKCVHYQSYRCCCGSNYS